MSSMNPVNPAPLAGAPRNVVIGGRCLKPMPQPVSHEGEGADLRNVINHYNKDLHLWHLSIDSDSVRHMAFMIDWNMTVIYANKVFLKEMRFDANRVDECNALELLLQPNGGNGEELVGFLIGIMKPWWSKGRLSTLCAGMNDADHETALKLYRDADLHSETEDSPILSQAVQLRLPDGRTNQYIALAVVFREGVLIVLAELESSREQDIPALMMMLSRREEMIRSLTKHRRPVHTDVAVLVADLQESTRISAEMLARDFFEMHNDIWPQLCAPLRKYHGIAGQHAGDGVLHYFFPTPKGNYMLNALKAAFEYSRLMGEINETMRRKRRWAHTLALNIGIHAGSGWSGVIHKSQAPMVTVMGDITNQAARLSDFARGGSIMVSKHLVTSLPHELVKRFKYGIRDNKGELIEGMFRTVSAMVDAGNPKAGKLQDIYSMPVTEISWVATD